jgi:glycosyltransferase involved in cell wall biosynthesis
MAFDPDLHRWCFPELPPVVSARTEAEIAATLEQLAGDPAKRDRLGAAGRAWIERNHGWRLVAERHQAVYEELLATA